MHMEVNDCRAIFHAWEEACSSPALWQRAFYELFGCFSSPEAAIKAFKILDTDDNNLVDAHEIFGALVLLGKGSLQDRMTLLFDIFDFNKEKEMCFDECVLMFRQTSAGLHKIVGFSRPPHKVIHNMTKQIWKAARKHPDVRILQDDWYKWWSHDTSCRSILKVFTWAPEDQRGLPTPDLYITNDYSKSKGLDDGFLNRQASVIDAVPVGSVQELNSVRGVPVSHRNELPHGVNTAAQHSSRDDGKARGVSWDNFLR